MRALIMACLIFTTIGMEAFAATQKALPSPARVVANIPATAPAKNSSATSQASLEQRLLQQEAAFLRKQYESVESYHDSVLATSYFALGTVFTIALLLLGYSWWFNTRAYESDKAHLREELLAKLTAAEDRIALKEQAARTVAESAMSARLDSTASTTSANHLQLRTELADLRVAIEKSVSDTGQKVDWLFKEFRAVEEMVWALNGSPQNALLSLAQGMEMCAEDPKDDMFDILSDRFEARVSEMVKSGKVLSDDMRQMIERNINSNAKKRQQKTQHVLEQLAKVGRPTDS